MKKEIKKKKPLENEISKEKLLHLIELLNDKTNILKELVDNNSDMIGKVSGLFEEYMKTEQKLDNEVNNKIKTLYTYITLIIVLLVFQSIALMVISFIK